MGNFIKGLLVFAFWVAVVLGIAAAAIKYFFVDVAIVGHNGMAPTLVAGDQIAIWRTQELNIGDVTVCLDPRSPGRRVIGRVVGKPGFEVLSSRGQLSVNGEIGDVNYEGMMHFNDTLNARVEEMQYGTAKLGNVEHKFFLRKNQQFAMRTIRIKLGLFLLGDNRTYVAEDSRYYGEVDPATCLGSVFMILKPAEPTGDEIKHKWLSIVH